MEADQDRERRSPRTILHDHRIEQRVLYGTPAMLFVLGALGLTISSGRLGDRGNSLALLAVWVLAIVGVGSIMVPLNFWYRCPSCKARLPQVPPRSEADRSVRFYCERCNVEWTTGFFASKPHSGSTDGTND